MGGWEGKSDVKEKRECVCVCQLEQVPGGPQWGQRERDTEMETDKLDKKKIK